MGLIFSLNTCQTGGNFSSALPKGLISYYIIKSPTETSI